MDHVYLSAVHERCLLCEEPISESQTYLTYRVCPFCRFHYTLTARDRIDLLADKGTFKESQKYLSSLDPLSFSRKSSYRKLLSQDQNRTGLTEAAVTGRCRIDGVEIILVVLDFGFMGGSMGIVVGEKSPPPLSLQPGDTCLWWPSSPAAAFGYKRVSCL